MSKLADLLEALAVASSKADAIQQQRYFKTGPGEYGEGDRFIGVRVPALRKLSRQYRDLSLADCKTLLRSSVHEERLVALFILVLQFGSSGEKGRQEIYRLYMNQLHFINNWDLVDSSAPKIVGAWLWGKDRAVLYKLARSPVLWRRRVAIMATSYFIDRGDFTDALAIAGLLLNDKHDLIHKAVGWMLREVGKRDMKAEESFLKNHHRNMPRTMLRYAIEKFPEPKRRRYLAGTVQEA